MLLCNCKGTFVPVAPLSKGSGRSATVMYPVPASLRAAVLVRMWQAQLCTGNRVLFCVVLWKFHG